MRIGILTQYYPPEMGAPQARLSHLAEQFVRRGHEVVVLTGMPNYPTGRVFPGYGGLWRREDRAGVSVVRCALYPTQRTSLVPRLASYFSFVLSSLLIGAFALRKLDYLITESPPLFLGLSGYLLSRRSGARWIFNVSDLWPESAVRLGVLRDGASLRAAYALEAFCYRKAWLVSGQSQEILADVARRFPEVATYHLSNGVDTDMFRPDLRSDDQRGRLMGAGAPEGGCLAVYAGLHGIAQGLDQILEAAALVRNGGLRILLVGDGPEKERLVEEGRRLGLTNVRFLEPLGRNDMPSLMASADIALVPLRLHIPGAVPSKLYEAMGAGVAVILVADGEAAQVVRETGAGVVVAPGDVKALADSMEGLARDPGRRRTMAQAGRAGALAGFDRRTIADRFIGHLEERAC